MLRMLAALSTILLLAACSSATTRVDSRFENLRNAHAAATPPILGAAY